MKPNREADTPQIARRYSVITNFNSGGGVTVLTDAEPQVRPGLGIVTMLTADGSYIVPIASIKYMKVVDNKRTSVVAADTARAENSDAAWRIHHATDTAVLRSCYRALASDYSDDGKGVCKEYDPAGPGAGVEVDGKPQCAVCGHPAIVHGPYKEEAGQ